MRINAGFYSELKDIYFKVLHILFYFYFSAEASKLDGSVSSEKFTVLNYQPDEDIPFYIDIIKGIFVFSFIWGFGAHLHER